METKVVWSSLKAIWFGKYNPAGHRKRKVKQEKEEEVDQRNGGTTTLKSRQEWIFFQLS